jgi:hypothetical protein
VGGAFCGVGDGVLEEFVAVDDALRFSPVPAA